MTNEHFYVTLLLAGKRGCLQMKAFESFLHCIDATNEKIGKAISYLLIPLALITVTEVTARYVFDKPTIWAWDANAQIFGVLILLGGGFTLLRNRHVSIEAVTEHVPPRVRLILELLAMLMLMFIAVVLIWQGGDEAWTAVVKKEKLNTIWAPYIFHIKILFPVAGILFFFQGLAKFSRDLRKLIGGEA